MTSNFIKRGVPFMLVVVGAPFIIQKFNSVRYKYRKSGMLTSDEQLKVQEIADARKAGVALDEKTEQVLEKAREIANTSWENKRGPRPWEETNGTHNQQELSHHR